MTATMANGIMCSTDFNDLCRLCAAKTSVLLGLHIFDREGDTRQIFKKIKECLPVQVTSTDSLPKMICEECVYKLDLLFEFREKSLKTESYLENILKSSESLSQGSIVRDTVEHMERVVCESVAGSVHGVLAVNLHVPENVTATNNENVHVPLHNSINTSVEGTLAGNIHAVSQQVLGVVTDTLQDDLQAHVHVMLSESVVDPITGESNNSLCEDPTGSISKGVNDSLNESSHNIVDSNIKCEPDVFIKDEDWASDSSDSETDREAADTGSGARVPSQNTAVEPVAGPSSSQSGHSAPVGGRPEAAGSFLSPAANGLLMLSCPQPTDTAPLGSDPLGTDPLGTEPSPADGVDAWLFCDVCGGTFSKGEEQVHYEAHCTKCAQCGALFGSEEALAAHTCDDSAAASGARAGAAAAAEAIAEPEVKADAASSQGKEGSGRGRKKWEPKVCSECGKQYRTNYKLAEHMRKHTGEKPFECSMCPKAFRSKIGLAQHEAKHTGQFDYTCSTCGKGFQCKSYLIVHQRVHSDLKPYPCTTCGRNFKTKQALLDHQNRHLGIKPYLCETCGRRFITKGLCKSHQRVHSGTDNKQYPCSVCNKLFVSKSYLSTHLRIHTGEKPFMCEVCGKGFLTRVDLRIHSTMHTGEKSFVCEWCGKAFARRDALRCHRRSHTGERPYSCDVCGQSFTQFSPLTIHKRLHTGERPYPCDLCSKAFVSRSTMMAHRKKHTT